MTTSAPTAASAKKWMIYGANGYTGEIAAREAVHKGLTPILAGRTRERLGALGRELNLPVRIFALDAAEEIAENLKGIALVLHCAGPFSATSRPMLNGCMKAGAHYLDITGEISVFEALQAKHAAILQAGITAISGVGFDVVPTDCLAAMLKRELPDASMLRMGMRAVGGGLSPGTAKTMVEGLSEGGCVRRDGKLTRVPAAYRTRLIPFAGKPSFAVTIPWGDVSTAYHSTGIPNVEFYMAAPPSAVRAMRLTNLFGPLLGTQPVQRFLKAQVEKRIHGPNAEQLVNGRSIVWGEVENAAGDKRAMRITVPQGYRFTVDASLVCVERVLAGEVPLGAATPSQAFGADFVLALPGVTAEKLSTSAVAS